MKRTITTQEQSYVNELIAKRKQNQISNLFISGDTPSKSNWTLDDIIDDLFDDNTTEINVYNNHTKNEALRIQMYEWENTIGPSCDDMTYLELLQFNNAYNNF
jgi:hypothetical protein